MISNEIARHQKAIEVDDSISKITLEVIIGKRDADPVKVRYLTSSETDLTAEVRNPGGLLRRG